MDASIPDTGCCRVCGGRTRPSFAVCFCCSVLVRQLHMPLVPVVAMAAYPLGGELHHHLRGYKDAAVAMWPSWPNGSVRGWPIRDRCGAASARPGT
jgi:hypothetical protein